MHSTSFVPKIAVDCGNPTDNLTTQNIKYISGSPPNPTTYLTSIFVECKIGYRSLTGFYKQNLSCQANARWSSVADCTRILIQIYFNLIIILALNFYFLKI